MAKLEAQTTFSCIHHQYCYWNEDFKNYQNCKGFDEKSLFIVSKDEKTLVYQIETLKSNFTVTDKKYNKEDNIWTYLVSSSEGNQYVYFFDPNNKEIRFMPKKDEKTIVQIFSITAIY